MEPSRAKICNCSQLRVCESVIKMSPMWLYMSYTLILQFLIIGCSFCIWKILDWHCRILVLPLNIKPIHC